jgi:hypothetical protein
MQLDERIRLFKRRQYWQALGRFSLLFLVLSLSWFVLFGLLEGAFYLDRGFKTTIWAVWGLSLVVFSYRFLWPPISGLLNLQQSPLESFAREIGSRFDAVQDRLLNLLQLRTRFASSTLAQAEAERKNTTLEKVDFASGVSWKPVFRLVRVLGLAVLFLVVLSIGFPDLIIGGGSRLLDFNRTYVPPPPFEVVFENLPQRVVENAKVKLKVRTNGRALPDRLFLYLRRASESGFTPYPMERSATGQFTYELGPLREDIELYGGNEQYGSAPTMLRVVRKPRLQDLQLTLYYPAHTGLGSEQLDKNFGNAEVPEGTVLAWTLRTAEGVSSVSYLEESKELGKATPAEGRTNWKYSRALRQPTRYYFRLLSPEGILNEDTIGYQVDVIRDQAPAVQLVQPNEDLQLPVSGLELVKANLTDDYGFSRLDLRYRFVKSATEAKVSEDFKSKLLKAKDFTRKTSDFEQSLDFLALGIEPGDEIEYFLEVWDNDGVNGAKSGTSAVRRMRYRTLDENYESTEEKQENVQQQMNALTAASDQSKRKLEELQQSLRENERPGYEERKMMEEMMRQQQQTQEKTQEMQRQIEELQREAAENQLYTEQTLEKINELQKLIEQMNEQMLNDVLKKMEQMLKPQDPQQMQRNLEQLKDQQESLKEQLERTIELFKQLKAEQKAEEIINRLQQLEEKQQQLQDQLKQAKTPEEQQAVQERQDQLQKETEKLQQQMDELKELKKDAGEEEQAGQMDELKQEQKEAEQSMEQAEQQMKKGNKPKAQQQQQQAQDKLKQVREKMEQMEQQEEEEQQQENYNDLRMLLENLLRVSFNQEELRNEVSKTRPNDPQLVRKVQQQKKIQEDIRLIQDSLKALAKRVFQIKQTVLDQLRVLNKSNSRSIDYMTQKQVAMASKEQTQSMTTLNELANMLLESMKQMQQQMQQQKKGGKKGKACKNPSQSMSMQQLGEMQRQLNEKLGKLPKPGGQQPQPQPGGERMSELAKQQEAIRQKLKDTYERLQKEGNNGLGNMNRVMQDMQETEEELQQGKLTEELLQRQQQILSRMLEFDKAVREREFEQERQSRSARIQQYNGGQDFGTQDKAPVMSRELLYRRRLPYANSYQQLIDLYFQRLPAQR